MSFTEYEEKREQYESFIDQLNCLRCDLKEARDRAEIGLIHSKVTLEKIQRRLNYILEQYYE